MKKSKILSLLLVPILSFGIAFNAQAKGCHSSHSRASHHSTSFSRSSRTSGVTNRKPSISLFKGKSKVAKVKNTTNVNKNVNINKNVIHKHYHTLSYHTTYYTPYGGSFRSSFWDNYWLYRAVTHHNTVVVTNPDNGVNETVNYGYSGLWKDMVSVILVIGIIAFIIRRKRHH